MPLQCVVTRPLTRLPNLLTQLLHLLNLLNLLNLLTVTAVRGGGPDRAVAPRPAAGRSGALLVKKRL